MADYLLIALCMASFFAFAGETLMAPFYPRDAVKKDVPEELIGIILAAYPIASFVVTPYVGYKLNQWNRKVCIVVGCVIQALAVFFFFLCTYIQDEESYIAYSVALRMIGGIGCTLGFSAAYALAADCYKQDFAKVLSYLEAAFGLAMSICPAVGSFFYDLGGFPLPFIIVGGLGLAAAPLLILWIPRQTKHREVEQLIDEEEDDDIAEENKSTGNISYCRLLMDRSILLNNINVVIAIAAFSFAGPSLTNYIKDEYHKPASLVGMMFPVYAALYAVLSIAVGNVMSKIGGRFLSFIGILGCIFVTPMMVPSKMLHFDQNIGIIFLGFAVAAITNALAIVPGMPIAMKRAAEIYPNEDTEEINNICSAIYNQGITMGAIVGNFVGGSLVNFLGYQKAYTYFAFAVAAYCAIYLLSGEGFLAIRTWKIPDVVSEEPSTREEFSPKSEKVLPESVRLLANQTPQD